MSVPISDRGTRRTPARTAVKKVAARAAERGSRSDGDDGDGERQERRPRAPRMRPDERREQVLAVAARVFAEKGYRLTNVTDIIEGAGIGRGTFYLYFSSKRDVFLDLIEKYFEGFEELLTENGKLLDEAVKEGGPRLLETWRENIIRILAYHKDNADLTAVVYREALGRDEDFSDRVDELSGLARNALTKEFKLLQERGMMREVDLQVVTTILMGTIIYVIMEHIVTGSKGGRRSLERLADELLAYHLRALLPEASEAQGALKDVEFMKAARRKGSSK